MLTYQKERARAQSKTHTARASLFIRTQAAPLSGHCSSNPVRIPPQALPAAAGALPGSAFVAAGSKHRAASPCIVPPATATSAHTVVATIPRELPIVGLPSGSDPATRRAKGR